MKKKSEVWGCFFYPILSRKTFAANHINEVWWKKNSHTWWNGTIFINTFFAIPTWSKKTTTGAVTGAQFTSNNTFVRSAYAARSTIFIYWTYLWHTEFVPTLIFICAVIVVFTRLVTFAIDAITFFATITYNITWSSWISNISIG